MLDLVLAMNVRRQMKEIKLVNVSKHFDNENVLNNVSLSIPGGKFFALLGPSGSGKTTILRLIAGFEKADSGKIFLGDEDITNIPVNKRRIHTVFQNYALFPHMNVFENIAYSLRLKHINSKDIQNKVGKILEIVGLQNMTYKSINQLSGGQQQRVALARSIVDGPDVLLLDEPLAALDPSLKDRMLIELMDLQQELKTTFIYVTHDQAEALTLADQMAILNSSGTVEQIGTPEQIYEFPRTSFVANFVGTSNLFTGILTKDQLDVNGLGLIPINKESAKLQGKDDGQDLTLSIRPEKIFISKNKPLNEFVFEGRVKSIIYQGRFTQYVVIVNNKLVQIFEQNEDHVSRLSIDLDDIVFIWWLKDSSVLLSA